MLILDRKENESNMEDNQQISQDSPAKPVSTSVQTGLLNARYVCPVCGAIVVEIEGNELRYFKSHIHIEEDSNSNHVSLILYHHPDGGNIAPGKALQKPFLIVHSLTVTPQQ